MDSTTTSIDGLRDTIAEIVAERVTAEWRGFWAPEDVAEELPTMIREAFNALATRTPAPSLGEDVVERVARAMFDATHAGLRNCYSWDDAWEPYQEHERERYYKEARAAVAALSSMRPVQEALGVEELREALGGLRDARTTLSKRTYGYVGSDSLMLPVDAFNSILRNIDKAREALSRVSGRSEEEEGGRPFGQPAGAPTGSSPQAVSGEAAHQAQGDE